MAESLRELERDVEVARARLLNNLSLVSSPMAVAEFKTHLRTEARSSFKALVEDVKGRVAANPAAALAVGAGLGWRLLRDPPIATALVGAGLFSLWRTLPAHPADKDYLATAQTRFGEQVGALATDLGERAADAAGALKDNVGDIAEAAKDKVAGVADDVGDQAAAAYTNAAATMKTIPSKLRDATEDSETRDTLLLGAAGLAVAAALGLAYQRRATEN